MSLTRYKKSLDLLLAEKQSLIKEKKKLKSTVKGLGISLDDSLEAQKLLQESARLVQMEAHKRISSLVTSCLSSVFGEEYSCKIIFEEKRGRTEASLMFMKGDNEEDPLNSCGGGIVDVAAFALRLSCLLIQKPPLRRILILDEPFKWVSASYRDSIQEMLERLSEDLDVQIIMITHIDELKLGKIIEV